jgi:type III restriction enzyme
MQLKTYQQRSLDVLTAYFHACRSFGDADTAFYNITRQVYEQGIPYLPVAGLPGLPYACLRVPTGGGKTLMACHAVGVAAKELLQVDHIVTLWLVPSNAIREQTIKALRDRTHPYRQALESCQGAVIVLDAGEAIYVQPATLHTETVIIVSTMQAFRVEDTEGRKVYEPSGALLGHFENLSPAADVERYENGQPVTSLANVLRLHRPLIIVDEAHNSRTGLSFETLARFNPACILEFTATPDREKNPSNVLYSISAAELKAEDMIKMPIRLETRPQWKELIGDAVTALKGLEAVTERERAQTGEYIRPIMLLQAQPRRQGHQPVTVEVVEACLKEDFHIPAEQIRRATGDDNQIEGLNLFDLACPVRYIITIQALREGWDCPFAYVLCSVAEQHGATAVEQIVGRVLRMPKAIRKVNPELNLAYAFVASTNFAAALNQLGEALIENGFQKQEVAEMIAQPAPPDLGPLFSYRATNGENLVFNIQDAPALQDLPVELAGKVHYDAKNQTIEIPSSLENQQLEAIGATFSTPVFRQQFSDAVHQARARLSSPAATPAERGEKFAIPILAIRQGSYLEQFEETHFLDFHWDLSNMDAFLSEAEFTSDRPAPQQGEVDISAEGKIKTQFITNLHNQIALLNIEQGWQVSDLVVWLDRNILHRDILATETGIFLTRLVNNLIEKRGFSLDTLVREKYRLRDAAVLKIDIHRQSAHHGSFERFLQATSPLEVSPNLVFEFDRDNYPCPVNSLYRGMHQFKNHYYADVGDLKANGEEFECAQVIDALPEVEFWVRNIDSQPKYSFWLQTSTGRFYPDFVCRLKDGRFLVVEYKGGHLYKDAEEKRLIGELWEKRSKGKCLFVMPTNRDFRMIKAKVK